MRYCRVIAGNAFGKTVDTFELSCGKAIENSELMNLFCRDLEDNANNATQMMKTRLVKFQREVWKKSLKESIRANHVIFLTKKH